MEEKFLMRDVFNKDLVTAFSKRIKKNYKTFNDKKFVSSIVSKLDTLSLSDRSQLITDNLRAYLPKDFPKAAQILIDSLEPELTGTEDNGMDGFIILPQTKYISTYGMKHYDISLKALYEMTKRFSSEGDIRHFIQKYPKKTLALLDKWAKDPDPHVRRLVSEGTRPRLPWFMRLAEFQKDPRPVLKLLEKLKEDPVLYVRRSVANNLNDIAKDNPELVIETLTRWNKSNNKGTKWIISHSLRTLLKDGHTEALSLLGYEKPEIAFDSFSVSSQVTLGKELTFSFSLTSKKKQKLMIDYIIHFMKKNGKQAPKVFKLSKKEVKKGENLSFTKKHSFKFITTRTYYPGKHSIEIQVNGKRFGKKDFALKI